MQCVCPAMVVGGASIDSLRSAMIMSMPEASVLVCRVRRSCASRSISGFRTGAASSAGAGRGPMPTIAASEK
jgi:hypothetical protein